VKRLVLILFCCNVLYTIALLFVLDLKLKFDTVYKDLSEWFYFNAFLRTLPYIIGSIYGYLHVRGRDSPIQVIFPNKWVKCVFAVITLWLFKQMQAEEMGNSIIISCGILLLRTMMSTTVAHLILVSFKIEQSSTLIRWLVQLLQANCFQFIGRVTFAFYLLNPLVIYFLNFNFGNVLPSDISLLVSYVN